jgi:hypothetical protein
MHLPRLHPKGAITSSVSERLLDSVAPSRPLAQDVLRYYGATEEGIYPPPAPRSPRESFNPAAEDFMRERGSYQDPAAHP